jgi:hypothetical protein
MVGEPHDLVASLMIKVPDAQGIQGVCLVQAHGKAVCLGKSAGPGVHRSAEAGQHSCELPAGGVHGGGVIEGRPDLGQDRRKTAGTMSQEGLDDRQLWSNAGASPLPVSAACAAGTALLA